MEERRRTLQEKIDEEQKRLEAAFEEEQKKLEEEQKRLEEEQKRLEADQKRLEAAFEKKQKRLEKIKQLVRGAVIKEENADKLLKNPHLPLPPLHAHQHLPGKAPESVCISVLARHLKSVCSLHDKQRRKLW